MTPNLPILVMISLSLVSPSIQFCGRRLHVHSNFMLTLTTSSLPSNVEEWGKLASSTQLVIFSPTFTLGRELLFHSSCFSLFDSKAYLDLCSKIKKGREKLKEVEKAVTSCLQKSSEEKEVSLAASEIEKLIGEKDEVSDSAICWDLLSLSLSGHSS